MDDTNYQRIAASLAFIHQNGSNQPSLSALANGAELSPHHFQRLFRRWVGISPKRYLQQLVLNDAKRLLRHERHSVLDASLSLGLSGPSRLHDHFVAIEAVTPGEFKSGGAETTLTFGVHVSPFGPCLLVQSKRGIVALHFLSEPSSELCRQLLERQWPAARIDEDPHATGETLYRVFHPQGWDRKRPFHLALEGTNFQLQVWRALLSIPSGQTASYSDLAQTIGRPPSSSRAVGSAVAQNPIAFLIPCHRVIKASGALSGYRWGVAIKRQLLDAECV